LPIKICYNFFIILCSAESFSKKFKRAKVKKQDSYWKFSYWLEHVIRFRKIRLSSGSLDCFSIEGSPNNRDNLVRKTTPGIKSEILIGKIVLSCNSPLNSLLWLVEKYCQPRRVNSNATQCNVMWKGTFQLKSVSTKEHDYVSRKFPLQALLRQALFLSCIYSCISIFTTIKY